jgi:SnoaL-like domain
VLALYTTLLDAKNFRPLDQVFVDDVLFNYGRGGDQKGLAALRDFIQSSLDVCGGTQHLLGQTVIDVNGDRASSRTYVHAQHQGVDDLGGPIFDTAGAYVDEWERRPEGWRITSRRALWSTVHGEPAIVNVERVYLE